MTVQLDRYHRQMLLPGFGEQGQRQLLEATALLVGCGALGTVIANTLARAGVGHLIIADRDFIELTNLQRQVLFDEADIANGLPKAEAARRKIAKINSQVKVTTVVDDVNHTNLERIAGNNNPDYGKVSVVIDGVDNFETRFLINDASVKMGIPYVYGGAVGTTGMTYTLLPHTVAGDAPWERAQMATPCLRCIFGQVPPPGVNPTCDTVGVLATSVSIVASYEANEALKVLTGNWSALRSTVLSIDTWHHSIREFNVENAYELGDCECCKKHNFEYLSGKFTIATTTLCGRDAVQIRHQGVNGGSGGSGLGRADFDEIARRLRPHGTVKANEHLVRAQIRDDGRDYELTVFSDGRTIVKGTKEPHTAKSIYAKYIGS